MRTELLLAQLVSTLQSNCGDMLHAAKQAGVSLIFINQWRKDDAKVNAALSEAEAVGTQGLVSEAIRRGARGIDEDIYYKGEVVGTKRVYSDGLMQSLLKAKVPEFAKDGEGGAGVNVNVNIANVMPRAENYAQWLEMKKNTLQLPEPPVAIEAEYVEVDQWQGIEL